MADKRTPGGQRGGGGGQGLVVRAENKLCITLGLVLISIGWVALFALIGRLGEPSALPWILGGAALLGTSLGGLLLVQGLDAQGVSAHPDKLLKAYQKDLQAWLDESEGDPLGWMDENERLDQFWAAKAFQVAHQADAQARAKREEGLKLLLMGLFFMGLDSIAFFYVPFRTAIIYLGLASLPVLYGLYIVVSARLHKKRALLNLAEVRRYQAAKEAGEEA